MEVFKLRLRTHFQGVLTQSMFLGNKYQKYCVYFKLKKKRKAEGEKGDG
jgi:hypothetical protein